MAEFTGLGRMPVLLAVGVVVGTGDEREFYAEVTDADRLNATAASIQAPGSPVEVAFHSNIGWMLVRQALKDHSNPSLARVAALTRPVNIYNMTGFAAGEIASNVYFAAQRSATIHRHHALCDARALRIAYTAARAARTSQQTPQLAHS